MTLMMGTLASRITGLVRSALLVQLFSPTITDAFNVAQKLPNLFRELLAEGALTNSFIPAYAALDKQEAKKLSGALFSLLCLVNGLLLLLAYGAAPFLVDVLLVPGSAIDRELTISLTRAVFPFLAAISLSALAMGILNAEERFLAPAWAPVALNVVASALMIAFPENAPLLALGFVLGGVAQLVVQLPALLRGKLFPRLGVLWHPGLREVLLLMVPFTVTTGARQFLFFYATRMLSTLKAGSVTAFNNADLFLGLVIGLFSVSPTLAAYSRLASYRDEPAKFRETLLRGLELIAFLCIPAGLLLLFYARESVDAVLNWLPLFGLSGMDPDILRFSVYSLAPLGLAIFPLGLNNLLIRTFYIRRKIRTPMLLTLVFTSLSVVLYVFLTPRYGLAGLSAATAISAWLQLAALLWLVKRQENLALRPLLWHAAKTWAAALLAALFGVIVGNSLPLPAGWWGSVTMLFVGGATSIPLYAALSQRLKINALR